MIYMEEVMKNIGLQLYSIKEISEKNFFGAIKLTADIGYDGIEFAGYFDTPAKELKKVLEDNGVVACGTHTGFEALENEFNRTVEYNLEIDNKYIIIPWIPTEMCNSRDAWQKTAEKMNFMNDKLREQGIKFGYHNHAFEFEKFDESYGYDILAENTSPDLLLEIDTFWVEISFSLLNYFSMSRTGCYPAFYSCHFIFLLMFRTHWFRPFLTQPLNSYLYGISFFIVPAFASDAYASSLWDFLAFLLFETSLWLLKAWLILILPLPVLLNLFFEELCVFTLGILFSPYFFLFKVGDIIIYIFLPSSLGLLSNSPFSSHAFANFSIRSRPICV